MDTILGVKINNLRKREILQKIKAFLNEKKFHQIATINPEFILEAQKNAEFKNILNNCDLNVADGIGIWFAYLRFGKILQARVTGIDLMHEILKIANEKELAVFLAVNKDGLSSYGEVRDALSLQYPNAEFFGDEIDPLNFSAYKMQNTECKILFCNFGAPYQEVFLNSLKNDILPHLSLVQNDDLNKNNSNLSLQKERCGGIIGVAVGVGGGFDYLTGKIKRAPRWMRVFGLEWLWRLILQPQRWKRIWNAVVVFPIKIIFSKK